MSLVAISEYRLSVKAEIVMSDSQTMIDYNTSKLSHGLWVPSFLHFHVVPSQCPC